MPESREFLLKFDCAPGDIVVSTSLVRDLKLTYGDEIRLGYNTNQPEVLLNNPNLGYVTKKATVVQLDYADGLRRSQAGERMHFTSWFHKYWQMQTNMPVQQKLPWPDLHLPADRIMTPPISGNYWLVFAGGKRDCDLKHWDFEWYNSVVGILRNHGISCVQSGAIGPAHVHPPLRNVALSVVGWGSLQDMFWQIYHAQGVICPITCAMHVAAAFQKPCVVIAGGREEPWWEAYRNEYNAFGVSLTSPVRVEHKFLHTVGKIDCCQLSGCGRVHIRHPEREKRCLHVAPRGPGRQELPLCLDMIKPNDVVDAVLKFHDELGLPKGGDDPTLLATHVPFHDVSRGGSPKGLTWMHPKLGKVMLFFGGDSAVDFKQNTVPEVRQAKRIEDAKWVIYLRSSKSLETKWFDQLGSFIIRQDANLKAVDTVAFVAMRATEWNAGMLRLLRQNQSLPAHLKCWIGPIDG